MAAPSRSADSFVHLHTHTEFSMLDGAARLDDLFKESARMEMPALAMTDHGNVFGAYEFWRKAKAHGVKPIIGMEGYLSPGSRHERKRATLGGQTVSDDNPGEMYTHMTLLAENNEGMHNLFRLSSLASLEGYYYKPRMDRELLETYGKGIIATTGCPSGEVQRLLQRGDFDGACQAASDYRDIFGEDNFFCELMDHGIEIEHRVRDGDTRLRRRARRRGHSLPCSSGISRLCSLRRRLHRRQRGLERTLRPLQRDAVLWALRSRQAWFDALKVELDRF